MELWIDIRGFEDSYRISNYGRVESKLRDIKRVDKRGYSYTYKRGGKILRNINHRDGYSKVSLLKNGKAKQCNIHRLVAEAFIKNPENKEQVNHKDGNKHNPHVDNLEWVTPSANAIHAYQIGLSKPTNTKFGGESHRSKRVKQSMCDGTVKVWDSMMSAGRAGYDTGGICRCCQNINKTHKNSRWEYTDEEVTEKTFPEKVEMIDIRGICPVCNIEFTAKSGKKKYCSRKCSKKQWEMSLKR